MQQLSNRGSFLHVRLTVIFQKSSSTDRIGLHIDFRFIWLLISAAHDPKLGLVTLRVGPGARLPRLPALYARKKYGVYQSSRTPLDYLDELAAGDDAWRTNYDSVEALNDRSWACTQSERTRGPQGDPHLVVASLEAIRKDKPNVVFAARVFFDGTHGISVNWRARLRDQERGPMAVGIKPAMRQKAKNVCKTFPVTADVA